MATTGRSYEGEAGRESIDGLAHEPERAAAAEPTAHMPRQETSSSLSMPTVPDAGSPQSSSSAVGYLPISTNEPAPTKSANQTSPSPCPGITKIGLLTLLAQHTSSSWNARTCEFAFYLYLIQSFPNTLLPASIYGLCCTGVSILFAGWVGGLVDKTRRVRMVRTFTLAQKASIMVTSAAFLGLFVDVKPSRFSNYKDAPAQAWIAFAVIVIVGCVMSLANIGITVAVERDWVTQISAGMPKEDEGRTLTKLNTYIRRIDLLSKLLAPLFVSLLTTAASYTFSVAFVMGFAALTLLFELWWIQIVFKQFPSLTQNQGGTRERLAARAAAVEEVTEPASANDAVMDAAEQVTYTPNHKEDEDDHGKRLSVQRFRSILKDWKDFSQLPVFTSTIAISLLYLTVLSFDGTMLSYLKARNYSDAFIAGQRGICVVTGLLGTVLMPVLEKRIGLVRAGAWSISSEALCLAPVLASFFVSMPPAADGPAWSATLLFGGMAASRIGLWAFDLCQLKELQLALDHHPRRNRFMGLQISLQNVADLAKYIVTLVLSRPQQFRWAALVSFSSVCLAVVFYAIFVKRERQHLFHPEWIPLLRKSA